jgi:Flp pilus assembly pilin Flp
MQSGARRNDGAPGSKSFEQHKEGTEVELINSAVIKLQAALVAARTREEGQTLVEYALIITMVSIASIGFLLALSGKINGVFTSISNAI